MHYEQQTVSLLSKLNYENAPEMYHRASIYKERLPKACQNVDFRLSYWIKSPLFKNIPVQFPRANKAESHKSVTQLGG